MTLKEKFETKAIQFPYEANAYAENCEKIADDYAIEFAEWVLNQPFAIIVDKELLEIFKKEKGL